MRSIYIFLNYSKESIATFLSSNFESNYKKQWLMNKENDPVLYIEIDYDRVLLNDLEINEIEELKTIFNDFSFQIITIDISGRYHGEEELLRFLKTLFSRFEAFVMDDYSEHLWTSKEIFSGIKVNNHKFFDYDGWYAENKS